MHPVITSEMENVTMATNQSACPLVDGASQSRPFLFFYLTVVALAIPSNSFSLYVSWQRIRRGNELGVYLLNLALSDLTFTVGLSLWMDFLWRGAWAFGGRVCVLSVYLLFTNFYTSDALLCCIAVNRYLAVVHPLRYAPLRRVGPAAGVCAAIWLLVVAFNAATISWEDSYRQMGSVAVCFDAFLPPSDAVLRANVARFLLGFALPLALVLGCSWATCRAVRANRATQEAERRRVLRLLALLLLCLLLCLGPTHVMMLLRALVRDCPDLRWFLYPYKVSIALSSLNCLADPLLYCFITRTGKENAGQVLLFFQGKRRSTDERVV